MIFKLFRQAGVATLLLVLLLASTRGVQSFLVSRPSTTTATTTNRHRRYSTSIAVPASELDGNLSDEEKTVVNVVRNCGPAVAFVTSVLSDNDETSRSSSSNSSNRNQLPARGRSLGSGSGFLVDARGYLVTNYHVIEQASRMQTAARQMQELQDQLMGNLTQQCAIWNATQSLLWEPFAQFVPPQRTRTRRRVRLPVAQVYVRIDSATNYQKCRIVQVRPELDIAVLKIIHTANSNKSSSSLPTPLEFGSSDRLLVGQSLIAIGNPFGLDNSVTTGVVSALNREIQTRRSPTMMMMPLTPPPIRNCIQTDCAINPGNSGGPLLNRQGQVVGVNTAILSTSGTNSGVGFAIAADQVAPVVRDMIRHDLQLHDDDGDGAVETPPSQRRRRRPWLGVSIVRNEATVVKMDTSKNETATTTTSLLSGCRIARVERNSPADEAGMRGLTLDRRTGKVHWGDCIVAVGGNPVDSLETLRAELDKRVVGEQIQITLRDDGIAAAPQGNNSSNQRVVYLTLQARPSGL